MTAENKGSSSSYYDAVRANVDKASGGDVEERVEVNQRALIDKILARYASAGAVYRELLQNSNDAEATVSEIYFTTSARTDEDVAGGFLEPATLNPGISTSSTSAASKLFSKDIVRQVEYRNNGMPFRPQDWSRLKKIAEGNPDESKVGAFGVGAYSMFSICESPMVLSGTQALAFVWKGDSLWTKTINNPDRPKEDQKWTTFVLKSRDPYPLGSLVEFGEFLCASLTFTKCLNEIRVFVNGKRRMLIQKQILSEPQPVQIQRSSSWWKNDGAMTASPSGLFSLKDAESLLESLYHVQVTIDGETAAVSARYLSALAKTKIPIQMVTRMERVTKKKPPRHVEVQVLLSNQTVDESEHQSKHAKNAHRIIQSFAPRMGEGRIFIGFRTSQTTGLAAHVGAPFVPTVEREAIDVQDQTLRVFNLELLEFSGILLRLTLEHGMASLGETFEKGAEARRKLDQKLIADAIEAEERKKESGGIDTVSLDTESDDADESVSGSDATGGRKGMWGFAKFMAKGVKNTIVKAVNTVHEMVDDGGELLHPRDPRPLCAEEMQAIMLMQSFCPRQSTPDHTIGAAIAEGFSRCLQDRSPPVLTRSGVVPGDLGRLPNKGIEAFVEDGVIRSVVYENCKEYHDVIANCRKLSLDDLTTRLSSIILEEEKLIRLFRWWAKFSKSTNVSTIRGLEIKENVRFVLDAEGQAHTSGPLKLRDYDFYFDPESIPCGGAYSADDLPMPESIIPTKIQKAVTLRLLKDHALRTWLSPLPVEIWIDYICTHPSMASGEAEWDKIRLQILSTIYRAYSNRSLNEQRVFASYCHSVMHDKRCIPFDSSQPTALSADIPSSVYVYSAELTAFQSIATESFKKGSESLKNAGVTEDFLLQIGVRKSVQLDFLFANLSTLSWNDDPRPLVDYLRSATLTSSDLTKLKQTQYLPAENDSTRMFAPKELYIPDSSLRIFPFVRILQWPSDDAISEKSPNGRFLVGLGMKILPPISEVLQYISDTDDDGIRQMGLDFVAKRLGPGGSYQTAYDRLGRSERSRLKFMPCVIKSPLSGEESKARYSVLNCVSDRKCVVMGFPTIDLGKDKSKLYGDLFQCVDAPPGESLVQQLLFLVGLSKKALGAAKGQKYADFARDVIKAFDEIFAYLSTRDFKPSLIQQLSTEEFIPCLMNSTVQWFRPGTIFFRKDEEDGEGDSATSYLFQVVDFSPFLSACGVKSEATIKDIFDLMIRDPQAVLAAVKTEQNYLALLRRVAAQRPFRRVSAEIRNSKFLLAYTNDDTSDKTSHELAAAKDIYIVDNGFFARMFLVRKAPHESGLEDFYSWVGSEYISQAVSKSFDVVGKTKSNTSLTSALSERIKERGPLLLHPSVMSRPLVKNAVDVLDEKNLDILEAPSIKAIYTFQNSTRSQKTTCCAQQGMFRKKQLVVVDEFDWFDVGYAIGELLLQRCELQDAFFISTLLDVPLEQLRARGFPVDRIIKPDPPEPIESIDQHNSQGDGQNKSAESIPPAQAAHPDSNTKSAEATGNQDDHSTATEKTLSSEKSEDGTNSDAPVSKSSFISILKNMYPGADDKFLSEKLGDKPDLDKVRSVAEEMAMHGYPNENESTSNDHTHKKQKEVEEQKPKSKVLGSKKLGKAFGGLTNRLKHHAMGDGMTNAGHGAGGMAAPPTGKGGIVPPEADSSLQSNMENMLANKVKQSPSIDERGIQSEERAMSIPEGLDHGDSCEVLPAQDITPFVVANHGKAETHNGIRVFSARQHKSSVEFLQENLDAVESFAVVLERLCSKCFDLPLHSIAIYHDPSGTAIAFNANGGIYCNIRYYFGLHYSKGQPQSKECFSYWYITLCHELAHNLVSAHTKDHAFYTESYASLYLPKLAQLL